MLEVAPRTDGQAEVASSSFLLFQECACLCHLFADDHNVTSCTVARLAKEAEENGDDPTQVFLPYWRACEVMTRVDFMPLLDHDNMSA